MPGYYTTYENDSVDIDPRSAMFLDHLSRYWWASDIAAGGDVLDCACGKGYGAFILASTARSALGVDLNPRSLEIAGGTFRRPNLSYLAHDVLQLGALGRTFDVITAFEIIEHIRPEDTDPFLSGLAACLKPTGKLLISTPNHEVVLKSGSLVPEFHINNFTSRQLRSLLLRYFRRVTLLGQFHPKGPIYLAIFTLDIWNLRHVVGRPVTRLLRRAPVQPAAADPTGSSVAVADVGYFQVPPEQCRQYRFSRWHWRQAGFTVAICEASRRTSRIEAPQAR